MFHVERRNRRATVRAPLCVFRSHSLAGGGVLTETERYDGTFAHEVEEYSIARFCSDQPRAIFVNRLLRGMFRRDPARRYTPAEVIELAKQIIAWRSGAQEPAIDAERERLAAAVDAFQMRSRERRAEAVRAELGEICAQVAAQFEPIGKPERYHASVLVETNYGDGAPSDFIAKDYPGAVWAAVRIKADIETGSTRLLDLVYVMIFRDDGGGEFVGVLDEEERWSFVAEGPLSAPTHVSAMIAECGAHRSRLVEKIAAEIDRLS